LTISRHQDTQVLGVQYHTSIESLMCRILIC